MNAKEERRKIIQESNDIVYEENKIMKEALEDITYDYPMGVLPSQEMKRIAKKALQDIKELSK